MLWMFCSVCKNVEFRQKVLPPFLLRAATYKGIILVYCSCTLPLPLELMVDVLVGVSSVVRGVEGEAVVGDSTMGWFVLVLVRGMSKSSFEGIIDGKVAMVVGMETVVGDWIGMGGVVGWVVIG